MPPRTPSPMGAITPPGTCIPQPAIAPFLGSKRRLACAIVGKIEERFGPTSGWPTFYDLCAGTASIARSVASRGVRTIAVDAGLWGDFWQAFQSDREGVVRTFLALVGEADGADACRTLNGRRPAADPTTRAAQFLAIQRAMIMGRLPTTAEGSWSAVCLSRTVGGAARIARELAAVPRFSAVHGRAEEVAFSAGDVVYVDPNYVAPRGKPLGGHYSTSCDVATIAARALGAGARLAISHHTPIPGVEADAVTLTTQTCLNDRCRRELLLFPRGAGE